MENLQRRHKILIVEDSEMNREILSEILGDRFDIVEAVNGVEAVANLQEHWADYSVVLLDIVMPEMDGFEVLAYMNKYHWIEDLPVIMISSESAPAYIKRAYDLGVADYISRPFNASIVIRRVQNTITLYAKQRKLVGIVAKQIYEKEKSNALMVSILSHIVEFRNGESGLHVMHISRLTEMLLDRLATKGKQFELPKEEVQLIIQGSALHDIGKISIPEEVLNKPGRLTDEEFAQMKKHTVIGADMLDNLEFYRNEPLVKAAYEICRWHHERYDGRGYPDGLVGDAIPLSAQIVSIADVYDALTSERCYKKAFSHEKAIEMITNGECGAFNPLLVQCLIEIGEEVQENLRVNSGTEYDKDELVSVTKELLKGGEVPLSDRLLQSLETERAKFAFLSEASSELIFVYTDEPPLLSMSKPAAAKLALPESTMDPLKCGTEGISDAGNLLVFRDIIARARPAGKASAENLEFECRLNLDGVMRPCHCACRALLSSDPSPKFLGVVGRIAEL